MGRGVNDLAGGLYGRLPVDHVPVVRMIQSTPARRLSGRTRPLWGAAA